MDETTEPGETQEELFSPIASPAERARLAARIHEMHGMDSVDTCRMRLVSLRTRIETAWPEEGGGLLRRHRGLGREAAADISDLLVALPTPLPLQPGGEPQPIILSTDTDLREVAGRAVDAGLALLDGAAMDSQYAGSVTMLESFHPDALAPIVVTSPTVGLLVATIIGTLEAVYESVADPTHGAREAAVKSAAVDARKSRRPDVFQPEPHDEPQPKRGPGVPRI